MDRGFVLIPGDLAHHPGRLERPQVMVELALGQAAPFQDFRGPGGAGGKGGEEE